MSGITLGLAIFGFLLALMALRVPIGVAMFFAGAGGYVYLQGGDTLEAEFRATGHFGCTWRQPLLADEAREVLQRV